MNPVLEKPRRGRTWKCRDRRRNMGLRSGCGGRRVQKGVTQGEGGERFDTCILVRYDLCATEWIGNFPLARQEEEEAGQEGGDNVFPSPLFLPFCPFFLSTNRGSGPIRERERRADGGDVSLPICPSSGSEIVLAPSF